MSDYIAKVVKIIDDYSVAINKGSADNISIGKQYLLLGIGEEIFDPDTKDSLGKIELVRGKVIVMHVQDKIATLTSDEWTKPRGKRTIKRQNQVWSMIGGSETEIINEQSELIPLNSPEISDVIKGI